MKSIRLTTCCSVLFVEIGENVHSFLSDEFSGEYEIIQSERLPRNYKMVVIKDSYLKNISLNPLASHFTRSEDNCLSIYGDAFIFKEKQNTLVGFIDKEAVRAKEQIEKMLGYNRLKFRMNKDYYDREESKNKRNGFFKLFNPFSNNGGEEGTDGFFHSIFNERVYVYSTKEICKFLSSRSACKPITTNFHTTDLRLSYYLRDANTSYKLMQTKDYKKAIVVAICKAVDIKEDMFRLSLTEPHGDYCTQYTKKDKIGKECGRFGDRLGEYSNKMITIYGYTHSGKLYIDDIIIHYDL